MLEIATLGVCDSCLLSKARPPRSSAYQTAKTNPLSSFLLLTPFHPPFPYDLSIELLYLFTSSSSLVYSDSMRTKTEERKREKKK